MNNQREKLVLAALMHDIGKFWQRADEHFKQSNILQTIFQGQYDSVVPTYPTGHPKYVHALWTYAFFEKYPQHKLLAFAPNNHAVQNLAAKHHAPSNLMEGFISLADKWSSGIDRPDEGEEGVSGYKEIKKKWGDDFVRKMPMFSIFDILKVGSAGTKGKQQHILSLQKLTVLEEDAPIFAKTLPDNQVPNNLSQAYQFLWKNFTSQYEKLPTANFQVFYHSLLNLLKEYTWSIPSATNIQPANVSLFEHLKSTAAITICLYDHFQEHPNLWDKNQYWTPTISADIDPIMMVCVDISGIQKFIYDIASSKAAKSLKGRSFYLQLLVKSIINQILCDEEIQLYQSNVIYASGGKCYLLLPNTNKAKKALNRIEKTIEADLWKKYKGKIYAAFGTATFRYKSYKDEKTGHWKSIIQTADPLLNQEKFDLGKLWKTASDRAGEKKRAKFKTTLLHRFDDFFPKNGIAYQENTIRCAVSGERFSQNTMVNIAKDSTEAIWVSPAVAEQIAIGTQLKTADSIAAFFHAPSSIQGLTPGNLATTVALYNKEKALPSISGINSRYFINSFPKNWSKFPNYAHETIFYGGNKMPENANGSPKTFHDLANFFDNNKVEKTTKLGFLRMDVDSLGQIFIKGLEEDTKSFAAYATLSMMLDLFFSGYLNTIREQPQFRDWIQILYAGGDDLFVIGRWDKVIDFAAMVRTEFEHFVGRDDLSISGGIAIVGSKYPITKAAELAAEAEEAAKHFNNKAKNAFTFFGETVSWHKEFEAVQSLKDQFIDFDGHYGRGALQQLQTYFQMKKEGEKSKDLSYKWHSAYYLSRVLERIKDRPTADFFIKIRAGILHNKDFGANRYLDLIALAARWAAYLLKMNL